MAQSWLTVKQSLFRFGGSNPSAPTNNNRGMSERLKLSDLESDEGTKVVSSVGSNPTTATNRISHL